MLTPPVALARFFQLRRYRDTPIALSTTRKRRSPPRSFFKFIFSPLSLSFSRVSAAQTGTRRSRWLLCGSHAGRCKLYSNCVFTSSVRFPQVIKARKAERLGIFSREGSGGIGTPRARAEPAPRRLRPSAAGVGAGGLRAGRFPQVGILLPLLRERWEAPRNPSGRSRSGVSDGRGWRGMRSPRAPAGEGLGKVGKAWGGSPGPAATPRAAAGQPEVSPRDGQG